MLPRARNSLPGLSRGFSLSTRLAAAAGVLFLEKIFLNLFVDFDSAQAAQGMGAAVRITQHWGFRFLVTLAFSLALFTYVRGRKPLSELDSGAVNEPLRAKWLLLHAALVPLIAVSTFFLYGAHGIRIPFGLLLGLALSTALASVVALFAGLAPWALWRKGAREVGILWLYAAIVAAASASAMQWSQSLWTGMARVTFDVVQYVLAPLIPTLVTSPATLVIDTGRFAVEVSEVCSGLEGMGLMLAFCGVWLVLFRKEYIFPRALALIPAGLLLIFVLNVLRIALLVLIGHAGLPEMAIYGFHSQAGWIAFNCAAGVIALTSRRSAWFNRTVTRDAPHETENPTAAYLMPLLAILAAGMIARLLSTGFEALYLLRPVAATLTLYAYRRQLAALDWRLSWRGPAVGLAAFVVWSVAAHFFTQQMTMPEALEAMPPAVRNVWIAIRIGSSVSIVPIAEELAYRGFLLRRLAAADFQSVSFRSVGPWALLASSVAFGLVHGAMWLPGIAAGLLYGTLLIRTGRLGEAVTAHATTNALVACWVVFGNQWQLWF
jgi:exosortase E/protease (VPEID-CTERM system)